MIMSDKPIGEIVGRQDGAASSPAPESGAAASKSEAAPTTHASATPAAGESAEPVDPIAGLKSALDKERERATKFEKETKAEKRERQRITQETAALRQELQALRATVNRPDPKVVEDEFYGGPTSFVAKQVSEAKAEFHRALVSERVESSRELARDRYEDFDEIEASFIEAARKDSSLLEGLAESRQPALLAYKRGKQLLAGAESAPDSRIAKLEAEIAELRAGRDGGQTSAAAETAAAPAQKPSIPKSNVGLRSTAVGKATSWAGPTPIDNVFGRQRRAAR